MYVWSVSTCPLGTHFLGRTQDMELQQPHFSWAVAFGTTYFRLTIYIQDNAGKRQKSSMTHTQGGNLFKTWKPLFSWKPNHYQKYRKVTLPLMLNSSAFCWERCSGLCFSGQVLLFLFYCMFNGDWWCIKVILKIGTNKNVHQNCVKLHLNFQLTPVCVNFLFSALPQPCQDFN